MTGDAWDEAQAEIARLRAEVAAWTDRAVLFEARSDRLEAELAALREDLADSSENRLMDEKNWAIDRARIYALERNLAKARALLADMLVAYVHFDHDEPTGAAARARAFLRGGEAKP